MGNTALALRTEEIDQRRARAKMVGMKEEKDLTKEDRPYYGVPKYRGISTIDSDRHVVYNSGFSCMVKTKGRFEDFEAYARTKYVELLQDQFYRMFMGYELHYFQEPKDEERLRIYNKTAIECGHPEYCINKNANTAGPVESSSSTKDDSQKIVKKQETVKADIVDVVDGDGNVVAENCKVEQKKPKAEKQEVKKEPAKEEKPKENKKTAEESVIFYERTPNGDMFVVDKDRHDGFKEFNAKILQTYPDLQKIIDACPGKSVKLYNYYGLVVAEVFMSGVPNSINTFYIDPAKIRDHYSFILTGVPNGVFPFDFPMASFEKYMDKVVNIQLSNDDVANAIAESSSDYLFLHHLAYSSVPAADLPDVCRVLSMLFSEIDRNGLNLRFKAIDYASKYSFTLLCAKSVGLAHFAKDNSHFDGLKISIRAASESAITIRVSGTNAKEFRDLIFKSSEGKINMKVSDTKTVEQRENDKALEERGKQNWHKKQEKKPEKVEAEIVKDEELPNPKLVIEASNSIH